MEFLQITVASALAVGGVLGLGVYWFGWFDGYRSGYLTRDDEADMPEIYFPENDAVVEFAYGYNMKPPERKEERPMGKTTEDLTGQTFGMLTVLGRMPRQKNQHHALWLCKCQCGRQHVVQGRYLKSGKVKSCGCSLKKNPMDDRERSILPESVCRLELDGEDPYQNLANAIVCAAADDYRTALKTGNGPLKDEVLSFFQSDWFKVLTKINAESLIGFLDKEHDGGLEIAYVM